MGNPCDEAAIRFAKAKARPDRIKAHRVRAAAAEPSATGKPGETTVAETALAEARRAAAESLRALIQETIEAREVFIKNHTARLGGLVRRLRLATGKTQTEFANAIGLLASQVSTIERGKNAISRNVRAKLFANFQKLLT